MLQQVVDVFISPLHCCQATCVLTGERFSARLKKRYEEKFSHKGAQCIDVTPHDLGQVCSRPVNFNQTESPLRIERQQPPANRFVECAREWPIMEDPKRGSLAFTRPIALHWRFKSGQRAG